MIFAVDLDPSTQVDAFTSSNLSSINYRCLVASKCEVLIHPNLNSGPLSCTVFDKLHPMVSQSITLVSYYESTYRRRITV